MRRSTSAPVAAAMGVRMPHVGCRRFGVLPNIEKYELSVGVYSDLY